MVFLSVLGDLTLIRATFDNGYIPNLLKIFSSKSSVVISSPVISHNADKACFNLYGLIPRSLLRIN